MLGSGLFSWRGKGLKTGCMYEYCHSPNSVEKQGLGARALRSGSFPGVGPLKPLPLELAYSRAVQVPVQTILNSV